jgi:hypothetical protein
MSEWSDYNFSAELCNPDAAPLKRVFHIAHIGQALQILEERQILARPVYDESRLNKSRVHVVWLSPNDWYNGSFYGNVRFHFDWEDLVQGTQIYWVEVIKYSPHAPRFIFTKGDPKVSISARTFGNTIPRPTMGLSRKLERTGSGTANLPWNLC